MNIGFLIAVSLFNFCGDLITTISQIKLAKAKQSIHYSFLDEKKFSTKIILFFSKSYNTEIL